MLPTQLLWLCNPVTHAFQIPALCKVRKGRGTHYVFGASEVKSLGYPPAVGWPTFPWTSLPQRSKRVPRPCGFCKGGALARPQTVTDDLDIDPSRLDSALMPWGLKRYHGTGHLHFITCSCYRRLPLLGKPGRRTLFLELLEQTRQRYDFVVVGYVVMPEHFHILIGEPERGTPSTVLQVVKQRFARRVLRALRQRKRKAQPEPVAGRREPVGPHLASPLL